MANLCFFLFSFQCTGIDPEKNNAVYSIVSDIVRSINAYSRSSKPKGPYQRAQTSSSQTSSSTGGGGFSGGKKSRSRSASRKPNPSGGSRNRPASKANSVGGGKGHGGGPQKKPHFKKR